MARAVLRDKRAPWEVGQAIVAAWFKVLQNPDGRLTATEGLELKQVFEEIFATPIHDVILDPADNESINILVPQPPKEVHTQADLLSYLAKFHNNTQPHHFHEELGDAIIFGCGK
ncbi:MAG TPA: hypothetical protein VM639_20525 [Dongiaceae bacterium]|nr:hypothetical protein [Dongiaceae bacterium]